VIDQAYRLPLRRKDDIAKKLRAKKDPGVDLVLDMSQEFRNEEANTAPHFWPPHTAAELRPIHYSLETQFFDD
jgi:hypothetical protein